MIFFLQQLSAEEKQFYEREADKQNGQNPIEKDGEEEEDGAKGVMGDYGHMHPQHEMHMQGGYAQMPPGMDPRHAGYNPYPHHMYGPAAYQGQQGYEAHYARQARNYQQYPQGPGHPYDQRGV